MSVLVEQDVLGLEVSVEDVVVVQVLQSNDDLCEVELGHLLRKPEHLVHVVKDLPARAELQNDEQVVLLHQSRSIFVQIERPSSF